MHASFYADHTPLEAIAQIMIASLFVGTVLINSTTMVKQHADRMAANGVPAPYLFLWFGFALCYIGGTMVLLDIYTDIGAVILIVFTVAATAIFHRFWRVPDPLMRHLHLSFLFSNIAVVGALLLLI